MEVDDKTTLEHSEDKTAFKMPNAEESSVDSENEQVELESGKIGNEDVERERERERERARAGNKKN